MQVNESIRQHVTLGTLSAATGFDYKRLDFVVRKHRIRPTLRIGGTRVFDPKAVARIVYEARRIAIKRGELTEGELLT